MDQDLNSNRLHAGLSRATTLVLAAALFVVGTRIVLGALAFLKGPLLAVWGLEAHLDPLALPAVTRVSWAAIGVGCVIAAAGLVWVGLGGLRSEERWFVLVRSSGEHGATSVSLASSAARALVAEAAAGVGGVWKVEPDIRLKRKGWVVRCTIFVKRDQNLIDVAAGVENTIAATLRAHTGVSLSAYSAQTRIGPFEPGLRKLR